MSEAQRQPDPVIPLCEAWLSVDDEIDLIQAAWGKEESRLCRPRAWRRMTPAERQVSSQGEGLRLLDARIEGEYARRDALYDPIEETPATTPGGAAAKLTVALRRMPPEDGVDARDLVVAVLDDLEAMA